MAKSWRIPPPPARPAPLVGRLDQARIRTRGMAASDLPSSVRARERVGVQQFLRLLEYIAGMPLGVSPKEIASLTGKSLNTAYDLLNTLSREGYVVKEESTGHYIPRYLLGKVAGTPNVEPAGSLEALPLKRLQGIANALNERTGCRVYLLLQDAHLLRLLDCAGHQGQLGLSRPGNIAESLHATALGKMLLAMFTELELKGYLGGGSLHAYTPSTITDRTRLGEALRQASSQGLVTEEEEYQEKLACIAAPIAHYREGWTSTRAVLGIAVPRSRFMREQEALGVEVYRAARMSADALRPPGLALGQRPEEGGTPGNVDPGLTSAGMSCRRGAFRTEESGGDS